VAEKAANATTADNSRVHSNGESRKDKCGDITPSIEGGGYSKKPLCNGDK